MQLTRHDQTLIAQRRRRAAAKAEALRMSEVSWQATLIQRETGCTRTEAMRDAEKQVSNNQGEQR